MPTDTAADVIAREFGYFLRQESAIGRPEDFAAHLARNLAEAGYTIVPTADLDDIRARVAIARRSQITAVRAGAETNDVLRAALQLIGTDCANYRGDTTCVDSSRRSPYATYYDGRWCDQCIARQALAGVPFPTPTDPKE